MAIHDHGRKRDPRLELQLWYLESLQPKLARAADKGVIAPAAAADLDRQLTDFLDLRRAELDEAA